jgi:hypothetical protein
MHHIRIMTQISKLVTLEHKMHLFFLTAWEPPVGLGPLRGSSVTFRHTTLHTRWDSSGRVNGPSQRRRRRIKKQMTFYCDTQTSCGHKISLQHVFCGIFVWTEYIFGVFFVTTIPPQSTTVHQYYVLTIQRKNWKLLAVHSHAADAVQS